MEWQTEPIDSDGSKCVECEQLIVGKMITGYMFVYDNSYQIPSDVIPRPMKVCYQCRLDMINGE